MSPMVRLFYTNSCGLYNKIEELKQSVALYNSDIVCITETHFCRDILDAEIDLSGYILFRNDRDFSIKNIPFSDSEGDYDTVSNGGGSLIFINERLRPTLIESFQACDSLAVQLETSIGLCNVVCVYRSMSLSNGQNSAILKAVDSLLSATDIETILVGDFNLPNISWLSGILNAPSNSRNKSMTIQKDWLNLVENNGLNWLLTDEITRRRVFGDTFQESTLDQLFTTNEAMISELNIVSPLGKSDHVSFDVELNFHHPGASKPVDNLSSKQSRSWSKVKPEQLLEFSHNINWDFSAESLSTNEMWNELHEKFSSISENVPVTRVKRMPWANSALKRARKDKDRAWVAFDSSPTVCNLNSALRKQELFQEKDIKCKVKYEKLITSNLKQNCKPFYAYLRSKRVLKSNVSSLLKPDGSLTKDNQDTAEVLADAFASVFVREPEGPLGENCYKKSTGNDINDIVFSPNEIQYELSKLDISK